MNRKVSIQLRDNMGKTWQFENIKSLQEFLNNENDFWINAKEGISQPNEFLTQRNLLSTSIRTLDKWNEQITDWDDNRLRNETNRFQENELSQLRQYWLWSGHPFVSAWINACKISASVCQGFLEYIKDRRINNITHAEYFKGYMLAYEFEMQDETNITKRRNAEKASYSQLRDRLDKKTNELIGKVEEFENEFTTWSETTKVNQIEKFNTDQNERETIFTSSQQEHDAVFQKMIKDYKEEIDRLEITYHEKLRLEKPAQYWKSKALEYKTNGDNWAKRLGTALVIGIFLFASAFYFWLQGASIGLEVNSLQGAIIFATIITIYAITIQSLSKMVFSSYHLQRDAEEREQLAYVYLALTNEHGKIDEESRKIVLQSLFSRADTGLLKDSSPTMPGLMGLVKQGNN